MNKAELDRLSIKRGGLLKKKRLLDSISKLIEAAPAGQNYFEINCDSLNRTIEADTWGVFINLIEAIKTDGAIQYTIAESYAGDPWGDNIVNITIADEFEEVHKKIGEEYHKINDMLASDQSEVSKPVSKHTSNTKKWYSNAKNIKWFFGVILIPIILAIIQYSSSDNSKKTITQNNINGNNIYAEKITYEKSEKIRSLTTLETGKSVADLSPNVYFYSHAADIAGYYKDLSSIRVTNYKKNEHYFQLQKIKEDVIIIGYINSENFSKLGEINENNPMSLVLSPEVFVDNKNLVGIPFNSIMAIKYQIIDVSTSSRMTVLNISSKNVLADVEYINQP